MKRQILYVTGTRADFGLMARTLREIDADSALELSILITGMHLSPIYGSTVKEIVAEGLRIAAEVPVDLNTSTGAGMARNLGEMVIRFTDVMERERPDVVLLLGDRGEMLAGAISALHLNIPCAHVHGGERSGTVDEPVRHAISKLSHIHFTTSDDAATRLARMGEDPSRIFVSGAPGLDGLTELASKDRAALAGEYGLDPARPTALMVFHPVLQEQVTAFDDTVSIVEALQARGLQAVIIAPNSDAGADEVRYALKRYDSHEGFLILPHLPRGDFVSWMAVCDVMIGNSSSGIIEAATFGTPVINVGTRQNLRLRNDNVKDVALSRGALEVALGEALSAGKLSRRNVYGKGTAFETITRTLKSIDLGPATLSKVNSF
ncbi:UDP-N-acetylglucosamine 2-epimerase [Rhizobium wuzhouense]|uniref:UDP-N-acetylglucosamine 2-epimerase (Hydrolyzing) n=1 Tax=Rhizobium wuzhouense TaxID=1986026 RepID=A0ABX5NVE8_9HYPH|nr:UDP-N-acetylglucosamine 2-epimerase [Rhizobium wuzhouense]PYB77094.1 UDP-N-acetylglucosamine 2-epimerase (hydrolyzing) [Rhizobium wuzhouense]